MQYRKTTLLCFDDQRIDLRLQQEIFESHGFRVLSAETWTEAKALLSVNDIDVVVLDYRLAQANAIDVAIEIRKDRPRIPIVLLSGFLQEVPEYFKNAVDGFVSKNAPSDAIVDVVRESSGVRTSGSSAQAG
jgi:DNA-binding NtrC family response regulator